MTQVRRDSLGFDASRAEAGDLQAVPAIRMINADDETRLEQFGAHLSLRSRYQRFFSPRGFLPGEVRRLTNLDPGHEVALVATIEVAGQQRLVGVARYVIDSIDHSAEMAIVIADDWQSRGLGGSLLARLLLHAEQHGIHTLKGFCSRPILACNDLPCAWVLPSLGSRVTVRS